MKTQSKMIEDEMFETKSDPFSGWSFILGLFTGLFALFGCILYISKEYKTIEDIDNGNMLIECDDESRVWYPLPRCKSAPTIEEMLRTCVKSNRGKK